VCVSVSLSRELWKNSLLDPDGVWGGGLTGSKDDAGRWGGDCPSEGKIFRGNVGQPIVTNRNFVV